MKVEDIIKVLEMENELIKFDPLTGEEAFINDLNKQCLEAHEEAIKILNKSIPKSPLNILYDDDDEMEFWNCPNCGIQNNAYDYDNWGRDGIRTICNCCGQKITYDK